MANVWANYVSEKLIHAQMTKGADGAERIFYNISVPYEGSKTGYSNFAVNAGQVRTCTNRDGDTVNGCKNILLGDPQKTRKVSICTKLATKRKPAGYKQIEMTNQQIADLFNKKRNSGRGNPQSVATEKTADATTTDAATVAKCFIEALNNETEEQIEL